MSGPVWEKYKRVALFDHLGDPSAEAQRLVAARLAAAAPDDEAAATDAAGQAWRLQRQRPTMKLRLMMKLRLPRIAPTRTIPMTTTRNKRSLASAQRTGSARTAPMAPLLGSTPGAASGATWRSVGETWRPIATARRPRSSYG
jgi:hypothetical protein